MHTRVHISLIAASWFVLGAAWAAPVPEKDPVPLLDILLRLKSDAAALERLQERGRQMAAECVSCHGENGIATKELMTNLAGQNPDYLLRQIEALISGDRKHIAMSSSLEKLVPEERAAVALYYASLPVPARPAETTATARGAGLYEKGCMSCHGRDAYGTATIPRLAGQRADYLRWTLANIQRGKPRPVPEMQAVCRDLTRDDIANLAAYLSALP
jgi:cytochrome c553